MRRNVPGATNLLEGLPRGCGQLALFATEQINTGNVDKLKVTWSYPTGDDVSYTFSPLVVDNVAYFAAKRVRWWRRMRPQASHSGSIPSQPRAVAARFSGIADQRGANYWESKDRKDRRLLVSEGGFLQAIDARTGKLVDSFADHGKLDLKIGLDRATPRSLPELQAASLKMS